jgi:hypothetical protein
MGTAMRSYLVIAVALAGAAVPALAQAPPAETPKAEEKGDIVKSILEQELEPPPGGYTYNPQGRRDPFVSLTRPVAAGDKGLRTRKPGMEGFLIQEVALKGIVKVDGSGTGPAARAGYIAIFLGTDGKSYFVNVGQRLFDGVITAIDATSVSFRQEVTDPLSPVKTRDLKKSLYASEEARQ